MFQKIFGGIQLDSCLAKCVLVDMIVFHQSGKRLFHLINLIFENKRGFYKLYELQNPDCAKIGNIFFKTWQIRGRRPGEVSSKPKQNKSEVWNFPRGEGVVKS